MSSKQVNTPQFSPMIEGAFPEAAQMLFCVGAQKAGTTWLQQVLSTSHECHLHRSKEIHYFDVLDGKVNPRSPILRQIQDLQTFAAGLEPETGDRYDDLLNRLEGIIKILRLYPDLKHPNPDQNTDHSAYINVLLHNWSGQKVICDITPSYALIDRPIIDQMASIGNAKFVYIMRDPISRAWSEVRMQVRLDPKYNGVSDIDFENLCNQITRDMVHKKLAGRSNYRKTINNLDTSLPPERVLYLFFEELFNPESLIQLCDFVGITPVAASEKKFNKGRDSRMQDDTYAVLAELLRPQYEFTRQRFGAQTPEAWLM